MAALAITETAAAGTVYWPPTKMGKALLALNYQAPADAKAAAAACKGILKPRHGLFAGFRCSVRYATSYGQTASILTVYARPLPAGRVCASLTGIGSCKPVAAGPLAGDPRVCAYTDDAARCALYAAENAAVKQARIDTGNPYAGQQVSCTPTSQFVYRCDTSGVVYTVTFTKGATDWTTTVTR